MDRSPPDTRAAAPTAARCARWFWVWVVARTAVWFGALAAVQPNPKQDLVESLAWGHQFAWGYPKQPPLTSWLAEAFSRLSPGDVWGVYLAGFLAAAVCLWAAWRVGLEFLPPPAALAAAVCLDGLVTLTGDAADFNNNIALSALWSLTVVAFVRATRTGGLRWWVALGVSAGLGLLCKYPIVFLLASLAGFLVCHRDGRRHLTRPGPYLSATLAAALFAPHAVWLVRHDFLPMEYAAARASGSAHWSGHFKHPAVFLAVQLVRLVPAFLILAPLVGRAANRPSEGGDHGVPRDPTDRALLHWAVLGPVALMLGVSLVTGSVLRERWGASLWTFVGVWVLALAGDFSAVRLRRVPLAWGVVAAGLLAFWVVRTVAWPYLSPNPVRSAYPGRQLAAEVARRWHARVAAPFPIVAGEAWRASLVCCYAPQRPVIYSSGDMGLLTFDPRHAFWTDDADLLSRGGVILWGANQLGDALPEWIRARFPSAEVQPPIVLPYQTGAAVRPDRVGIAVVWPASTRR